MHKVNIVIPVYNGLKYLEPLYQSLKAGITDIDYVITIMNDGSIDATEKWAMTHPDIKYIKNKINSGFSRTCNSGAKSLDSEYILFLNQDIIVKPGFLNKMLEATEKAPWPKIVGAKLLFPGEKIIQHAGIKFMAIGYPYEVGKGESSENPMYCKTGEMEAVTAACMLVERKLFDRIGGFDEDFINGWEDSSFCLSAREHGAHIIYCAEAKAIHYLYSTEERFIHERKNKKLFFKKWISKMDPCVITPGWIAIAPSWECNLKCKHCDIWKKQPSKEIDLNEFRTYIAHEFYSNITNVAIFGGEPTLYHGISDLIAHCMRRWPGQEVGLVTNGTMPVIQKKIWESFAKAVERYPVIRVSLDGREEVHDELRGRKGVFNEAMETIHILNTLWPGKGGISITVYPETVDELPYLVEMVEKMGITFCLRAGVSGSYFGGKVEEKWTPDKIMKIEKIINETPSNLKSFDKFVLAIPEFLRTGKHKACVAYRKSLVVSPDLSVSICHELPAIGHLRDIPNIWGKTREWCQMGVDCTINKCFKNSCFIDGPGSLVYTEN